MYTSSAFFRMSELLQDLEELTRFSIQSEEMITRRSVSHSSKNIQGGKGFRICLHSWTIKLFTAKFWMDFIVLRGIV